jgi:O-antigen/teichoic acid export membrane protein
VTAISSFSGKVTRFISVIRLKPFNITTPEGRAQERLRRLFWTGLGSILARSITTVTTLVTVPITLNYLGVERFGLWMTITSIVAILGFADLGVGNVILNFVSEANGKDDRDAARNYITTALFVLSIITIALTVIFGIIFPLVGWEKFFNVTSQVARQEAGPAMMVFIICFLIGLPLSLVPRIQMGFQEGYISSIYTGITGLIGLGAIVLGIQLKVGLPWLVLIFSITPVLGNLTNGIGLFVFQRPWLRPKQHDIIIRYAKEIVKIGFYFLILQIANAVMYTSDNILIAKILGPEAVTYYAVPSKLFMLLPNILYMFLAPLWPAFSEANARGDFRWAQSALIKAITVTLIVCLSTLAFFLVFGKIIFHLWVGSIEYYSVSLILALGIWMTLFSIISALSLYLNAINKIRYQVIYASSAAILSIIAKILLTSRFGLSGVVWGGIGAVTGCMLVPYIIFLFKRFSKSTDSSNGNFLAAT